MELDLCIFLTSHSTLTTMFQNPMPKPSCQKSRKTILTQKVLVTQSSNSALLLAYPKTYMCKFSSLSNTFSIVQIDGFFYFLSGGVKQTAKNFTFCWFWLGKMHQNGLSGTYLGFEVCQIQWHRFWVYTISGSMKNHNFRQKFHILLILTGKNALKWLEWCIFRVQGMLNPMALVSSLYDKWFLKNQNFRRQVA